ncbi:MAG: HD domain-containing protein [Pseudomonadales bacterium]
MLKVAKFTKMIDGDTEDYEFLEKLERGYASKVGERLYDALADLETSLSGYQVSRLEHSLQSATRAYRDGADTDWIVSALIHDIGDVYAPYNHDQYAAVILSPYVREQCRWVVEKHGIFQRKYYAEQIGGNPDARDQFKDHPLYNDAVYFCEMWDQTSFDPEYDSLPLEFFKPMLLEVFAREVNQPEVLRPDVREPLNCADTAKARAA